MTVPRARAADRIIAALRSDIAAQRLPLGARLPSERDLAESHDVSQPTAREALRALTAMGLIEVRHGSGAYVVGGTRELLAPSMESLLRMERVGIFEVLELRGELGRLSVSIAVDRATDEEIVVVEDRLRVLLNVTTETKSDVISDAVLDFHHKLAACSHNPLLLLLEDFLLRLLIDFQRKAKRHRGSKAWQDWTLELADDRQRMVECLKKRDRAGIEAAVDTYLEHLHGRFSSDPALAGVRLAQPI